MKILKELNIRRINFKWLDPLLSAGGIAFLAYALAQSINWVVEAKLSEFYFSMATASPRTLTSDKKSEKKKKKEKLVWKEIVKIDPFNVMPDVKPESKKTTAPVKVSPLKVKLLGTIVGETPEDSWAIIKNERGQTGVYRTGEEFAPGVTIVKVEANSIIVARGQERETIPLYEPKSTSGEKRGPPSPASRERRYPRAKPPSPRTSASEITVVQEDENHFVLEAEDVERALEDLGQILTQARIVPYVRNGKTQGFKVFGVRPGSIFDKIGLKNGDVIKKVNGMEIKTMQEALSLFRQLKEETEFEITIERKGVEKTFYYRLR